MTSPANFIATIVGHSTERFGVMQWVDTDPIVFIEGSGSFHGFVAVPEGCRESPAETVFLVRHYNPGQGIDGRYLAYGARQNIQ